MLRLHAHQSMGIRISNRKINCTDFNAQKETFEFVTTNREKLSSEKKYKIPFSGNYYVSLNKGRPRVDHGCETVRVTGKLSRRGTDEEVDCNTVKKFDR